MRGFFCSFYYGCSLGGFFYCNLTYFTAEERRVLFSRGGAEDAEVGACGPATFAGYRIYFS